MSVTVDQQPLAAEEMGLRTVGQVLAHLQRDRRLVVQLLIDGHEPDLACLPQVRKSALDGHTVYIETADPGQLTREVLDSVEQQLQEADRLRNEACDLLTRNNHVKAMEKLSGCFTTWQHAQESLLKVAQLLRIDLSELRVGPQSLEELLNEFTAQLRQIKSALENRDFVSLTDILTYEATETSRRWGDALAALRGKM